MTVEEKIIKIETMIFNNRQEIKMASGQKKNILNRMVELMKNAKEILTDEMEAGSSENYISNIKDIAEDMDKEELIDMKSYFEDSINSFTELITFFHEIELEASHPFIFIAELRVEQCEFQMTIVVEQIAKRIKDSMKILKTSLVENLNIEVSINPDVIDTP